MTPPIQYFIFICLTDTYDNVFDAIDVKRLSNGLQKRPTMAAKYFNFEKSNEN